MSTTTKQQLSDVPLTMTLWPSALLLNDANTTTVKIYEKDPQTLSEVIRIVEKIQCSTTTNSHPDTVTIKSNNDRCFFCG